MNNNTIITKPAMWKKTLLCQSIIITSISMPLSSAWADECPTTVTSTIQACSLTGDESVFIQRSGVIETSSPSPNAISVTNATHVSITNNGTIEGSNGRGIYSISIADAGFSGRILNRKGAVITGSAAGILAQSWLGEGLEENSSISNRGVIRVNQSTGPGNVGIAIYSLSGGATMPALIRNTGDIDVSANVGNSPSGAVAGITINNHTLTGLIANRGRITVNGQGDDIGANALYVSDIVDQGILRNRGTLDVSVLGDTFANAYGIFINGNVEVKAQAMNYGDITVEAKGMSSYSRAFGIRVIDTIDGWIKNHDTLKITSTLDNTGSSATLIAAGMHANTINSGGVRNNGIIEVTGSGNAVSYDTALVAGIYAQYLNDGGEVINTGSVTASITGTLANAYSVYIEGGEGGVVSNKMDATLTGNFYIGGPATVYNDGTIYAPLGRTVYIAGNYEGNDGVAAIAVLNDNEYSTWQIAGILEGSTLLVTVDDEANLVTGNVLENVITAGTLVEDNWTINSSDPNYQFNAVIDNNTLSLEVTASGASITSL